MVLLALLDPWMAIQRGALRICYLMALRKLCGTAPFGYFFLLLRSIIIINTKLRFYLE